jgi:hypothetical protein
MMIIVILAMFASLIGFMQISENNELARASNAAQVTALSENMAFYRSAVINYVNTPGSARSVCEQVGNIPTGYVPLNPPLWTNCILNDGTVVVYARSKPEVDIIDAISRMAQGSMMAGRANTTVAPPAAARIDPPFFSTDAPMTVPALPSSAPLLIKGVPIWLASP